MCTIRMYDSLGAVYRGLSRIISVSRDGKTLATGSGSEHAVRLWDLGSVGAGKPGKELRLIEGLTEPAQHLALSPYPSEKKLKNFLPLS